MIKQPASIRHKSYSSKFLPWRNQILHQKSQLTKKQLPVLPKPDAVLISRNSGGIGDMLMLTPTFHQIKVLNPDKKIILCTSENYQRGVLFDVMKYNPDLDKVITANELLKYNFKKVYNFNTGLESLIETKGEHLTGNRIDIFAELANITLENKHTVYTITAGEVEWAKEWIKKNVDPKRQRLIGVQVSATTMRRTWPLEKLWLLAFKIIGRFPDATILFFNEGTPPEAEVYPNFIHIAGMPIRQVAALINECELTVVPDSALLHIAGALNKKTVALFGPSPPKSRLLYYPEATGIWIGYPCSSSCWYQRCFNKFKCMTEIPVDMVWDQVEQLLLGGKIKRDFTVEAGAIVIRMGGIGDLIALSNALKEYKELHPDIKLTLATKPENMTVLKGAQFLDNIIPIPEFYKSSYSKVIDLRYKVESPEVGGTLNTEIYKFGKRPDIFCNLMGVPQNKSKEFYVHVDEDRIAKVKKMLNYSKRFKYVGVHSTCTSSTRTVPPEYVETLSKMLTELKNVKVVLFGKSEFWHAEVDVKEIRGKKIINFIDETGNTADLIALCSIMDYIIGPDSSAIHIAGALKKPCLALFGNIDPITRIYDYPTVKALFPKGELPCIPCHDFVNPCMHWKGSQIGGECMRKLTPQRIFEEAKEWFNL